MLASDWNSFTNPRIVTLNSGISPLLQILDIPNLAVVNLTDSFLYTEVTNIHSWNGNNDLFLDVSEAFVDVVYHEETAEE